MLSNKTFSMMVIINNNARFHKFTLPMNEKLIFLSIYIAMKHMVITSASYLLKMQD